jgi:hypothetical protein
MTAQRVKALKSREKHDVDFASPTFQEFAADAGSEIQWIWHGYIAAGRVTLLTSQWKCGKTTLLSLLIARMGMGGTLAGREVRPGRVLVVSEEDQQLWARRCRQLNIGEHARFMCRPYRGRRPTLDEWWDLLDNLVERQRAEGLDLVIIDALAGFVPGGSENDARTVVEMLLALQELTRRGIGVVLLHHPKKGAVVAGQAARGSGALGGSADIILEMDGLSGPTEDDRRRRIAGFARFTETARRLVIELNADGTDYAALGDFDAAEADDGWQVLLQVLSDAHGKLTRREILAEWPDDHRKPADVTLWRWLQHTVRDGKVKQQGSGSRCDPFRFWLAGMEKVWVSDPYYLAPLPPLEDRGERQKALADALAGGKGEGDADSELSTVRARGPRRHAAVPRARLGDGGLGGAEPTGVGPAVAGEVPEVLGVRSEAGPSGARAPDPAGSGTDAAGTLAVAEAKEPSGGGPVDPLSAGRDGGALQRDRAIGSGTGDGAGGVFGAAETECEEGAVG